MYDLNFNLMIKIIAYLQKTILSEEYLLSLFNYTYYMCIFYVIFILYCYNSSITTMINIAVIYFNFSNTDIELIFIKN